MIFLLPSSAAARILDYGSSWGSIDVKVDEADAVVLLVGASKAQTLKLPVHSPWLNEHYLSSAPARTGVGVWSKSDRGLSQEGLDRAVRGESLDTDREFRPRLRSWNAPPLGGAWWVLTVAAEPPEAPEWAAWNVSRSRATWFPLTLVPETAPLLQPLIDAWPLQALEPKHVLLIGAGSIGSAAAIDLASYGVRRLSIVDPQHLEPHNFARHPLPRRLTGRLKATALRDHLTTRDPDMTVSAHVLDVILNADDIRPMLQQVDIAICATDGVASRRVANHLAVWAGTETVFACVVEEGAYGEILRVRPHITGCLLCDRDHLHEEGALDPEPELDRDYTVGGGARPMTAVGGDLALVGQLAAKVVVASLLERLGDRSQALPGDALTVPLHPTPDLHAPFEMDRALDMKWRDLPAPRATCPTCGAR